MSQNTPSPSDPADTRRGDSLPSVYEDRRQYIERLEKANLDLEQRIQEVQTKDSRSPPGSLPCRPPRCPCRLPANSRTSSSAWWTRSPRFCRPKSACSCSMTPNAATLYATQPAVGLTRDELTAMERRVAEEGVSNEVFRDQFFPDHL